MSSALAQLFNAASSNANALNDPKLSNASYPQAGNGFRISDAPVLRSKGASGNGSRAGTFPASNDTDLLYVIARDPKSLFVYWDLNWTRVFGGAGLSARQVHLRIYRQDGSVEATREINPFLGHCYVDVAAAGTGYYCELGCFDDEEWKSLVRSGKAATPQDRMSEDVSAQFATLPLHLNFQRMLDILRTTEAENATLAQTVARLQEKARATEKNGHATNGANGNSCLRFSRALACARHGRADAGRARAMDESCRRTGQLELGRSERERVWRKQSGLTHRRGEIPGRREESTRGE